MKVLNQTKYFLFRKINKSFIKIITKNLKNVKNLLK
jgi:hypothetical protein